MNKYMLTLVIAVCFFMPHFLYSVENNLIDLSILNDTDNTVLIIFNRALGGVPRAKLLEAGEAIDFGRVYEASVQSYSTLWGYIAPAKHIICSVSTIRSVNQIYEVAIRIKGIVGRTLFHPFGQWDYDILPGKKAFDLITHDHKITLSETVLDAFPTAKRKIMYTPRYILGLPQYSSYEDALEACILLENKWRLQLVDTTAGAQRFASNVIQIIDESRKAFQYGQADVPLHIPIEMRSQLPCSATEDEDVSIAWS